MGTAEREYAKRRYWSDPERFRQAEAARRRARGAPPRRVGRDPEKVAGYRLRDRAKRYGLSPEELQRLLDVGACQVCGTTDRLHVDHQHGGAVRGVLCDSCNNGLGRFKDDPVLLEKAAAYLRSTPTF